MERFLILSTIKEQSLANRACAALENAGIPVMIEHVELRENGEKSQGFRLLVPSQYTQTAKRIYDATVVSFQNSRIHQRIIVSSAAIN